MDLNTVPQLPEHNLTEEQTEQLWDAINEASLDFDRILPTLSNAQLGNLLRNWISGAEDTGYEGFSFSDLVGIARMKQDMALFARAADPGMLNNHAANYGLGNKFDAQGQPSPENFEIYGQYQLALR